MVTLSQKSDTITERLKAMFTRTNTMQAFLNRNVYKMYQDAQRKRWMSQGGSEGSVWDSLSPKYALWKKKKYRSYDGGGSKLMIATNALQMAAIDNAYKIATNTTLTISIAPDQQNPENKKPVSKYAMYAANKRPFMKFGDETIASFKQAVLNYVSNGESK